MSRLVVRFAALAFVVSVSLTAQTLPELFQKA